MSVDPETRDVVQNIYLRKVEKIQGELYNSEFATFEAVKDPIKEGKEGLPNRRRLRLRRTKTDS